MSLAQKKQLEVDNNHAIREMVVTNKDTKAFYISQFNIKTGVGVNIVIRFDEDFDWQSGFENKIYTPNSPSCRHLLSANLGRQVSI